MDRLHLFSNMYELGKTNLEINNLVHSLDSPINAELLPAICFLEVSKFRAIVSLSRLGLPALPHRVSVGLQQLCSARRARKLPFWQNVFGSRAVETGAFRTAWARVMSLNECQKSEHNC